MRFVGYQKSHLSYYSIFFHMSSYPIVNTSVKNMSPNVFWKIDGQILLYTERQKSINI